MPIKEGEHVYVLFEDTANKDHGLWVTRIPENKSVDQLNLVPAELKYQQIEDNDSSDVGIDLGTSDTELDWPKATQSSDFAKEEVPDFTGRVGDRIIHGSNNAMILLSRDRVTSPSSGIKDKSGTIVLVAGRNDKENLNLKDDQSYVYISMKSDIDQNMNITVGDKKSGVACIGLKSDEIRVFAKKGMKVVVEGGDLYLHGKNVYHSDKSSNVEPHVLGDTLKKLFEDMLSAIGSFSLPTPAGLAPLSPLKTVMEAQMKLGMTNMLSKTIKLKKN